MVPIFDPSSINWNSITDTRSFFESILGELESKDEEIVKLREEIVKLQKSTENSDLHKTVGVMSERIEVLEVENREKDAALVEKDAALVEKDAAIEQLRAEIAAFTVAGNIPQAVLDKIEQLEATVAKQDGELKDAHATNSALSAHNLGIDPKRAKKEAEKNIPKFDPVQTVVQIRTHRDTPAEIYEYRVIDRTVCPTCDHALSEPTIVDPRIVEDVVNGRLVALAYTVPRRYCRKCGKLLTFKIPGVMPNERFGAHLMALEETMRMYGIPYETIRMLINIIYHADLAKSTVIRHVGAVTKSLYPVYESMLEKVFLSAVIRGDETTWKINGVPWWLWVLVADDMTVFHINESRGGDVVEMLLGGYDGHVVSDSWGAWNRVGKSHQKCHYHYMRELHLTLYLKSPGPEFKKFFRTLRKILLDSWYSEKGLNTNDTMAQRNQKIRNLQARIRALISKDYTESHCKRFVKRLRREKNHLFTFIRIDGECHNNSSERALRPSVVARKVTYGNKTYKGAYNHAVMYSIRETCRMRGINPYDYLVEHLYGKVSDIPKATTPPITASAA